MPIPVLTIEQMREWERVTWAGGQTEAEVIRRVGARVAAQIRRMTRQGDQVLILAGTGNNGADARCAGGFLTDRRVDLLDVVDPVEALSRLQAALLAAPALVVDGLFGIGLNRPLSAEWVALFEQINSSRCPVLSVDVPSGLNADTGETFGGAIRAQSTLTVGAPKKGMLQENAWQYVGRLEVASNVGLAPCPCTSELLWTMPEDFLDFPPERALPTHKGSYGHLAIVAGSLGYHGAAVLAARGAQRARPGLITLHAMEGVYHAIAAQLQAVMVTPWAPEPKLPGSWTACLIGPGLASPTVPDQMKLLVRSLWKDFPGPVVVDASGLDWLPIDPGLRPLTRILTPHPGEAARLLRATPQQIQADRLSALRKISKQFGNAWVILKGHQTLIGRSTGDVIINGSGNPYLAQGGSGDVLAGYLAGLLAQPGLQINPQKTLAWGVWQHGAAADELQEEQPNWVVEDLAARIGSACKAIRVNGSGCWT